MTDRWVGRTARFGLACRGLVYLVIAVLAIDLARGHGGSNADTSGALEAIAHHRLGHVLVLAIAVGFGCLGVWQAILAIRSQAGATGGRRLVAAGKALVDGALCVLAVAIAASKAAPSGGNQQAVDITGRVMRHTAGRFVVGAAGIATAAAGLFLILKGLRRRYDVEVHITDVPKAVRGTFETIGGVGMAARGLIVTLLGYFVVEAAVTFDPGHAKGLDGVLASVVHHRWGPWLLVAIAVGLACFGLFSLLEARYART